MLLTPFQLETVLGDTLTWILYREGLGASKGVYTCIVARDVSPVFQRSAFVRNTKSSRHFLLLVSAFEAKCTVCFSLQLVYDFKYITLLLSYFCVLFFPPPAHG